MKSCPIRTPDYVKLEQEIGTKPAFALFRASSVTPELATTNGKPSKIFEQVQSKLDESAAIRVKAWTYSKSYVTSKEFLAHKDGELALYQAALGGFGANSAKTGHVSVVLKPYETAKKGTAPVALRPGAQTVFQSRVEFNSAAADWGKNLKRGEEEIRGAYMSELLSRGAVQVGQETFVSERRLEPFTEQGNWIPWHKRRAGAMMDAQTPKEVFQHATGNEVNPKPLAKLNSKSLNRADRAMARTAKAMGAKVVYDSTLKDKGDVRLTDGQIVVKINPKLAGADTLPHELGHVLIDSMGGTSDPLIAAGIAQLKDTDLWKQVEASYSERSADVRAKEVLATAIGLEAAALMGDGEKARKWTAWLALFMAKVRQVLGLQPDAVKTLAARVVLGRMPSDADWKRFNNEYQSKKPSIDLNKAKLAKLASEIQKKAHDLDIEVGRIKDKDGLQSNKERIAKYKQLQVELETMISNGLNDPETALVLLQTLALEELTKVMDQIELYLSDPDVRQIYPSDLLKFRQISSLFDLQNIMNAQLEALPAGHPQRERFVNAGASIETLRTNIENFYLAKGREVVTHTLMDYDTQTERKWQIKAEKEYRDSLPSGEKVDPLKMADFVETYLAENEEKIMQDSFDRIHAALLSTKGDIGWMEMMLNSVKNMDDSVLPMLADMVDTAVVASEREFIRLQRLHTDKLEKLQKAKGNPSSYEELYGDILERDATGKLTGNLTGKYLQEFNETIAIEMGKAYELLQVSLAMYQSAVDMIAATYMEALTEDEIRDKMEALVALHGTEKAKRIRTADVFFNYKPLAIYTNPQYEAIMALDEDHPLRDYYESLMDLREFNDAQGPEWAKQNQRLPFVRKNGLDDLNNGNLGIGTMQQWWNNQKERKSDDSDTHTVRKDASGRMIYSLPLFFRRAPGFDVAEQSFDVGTIMMMETANRVRYKHMHKLASQVDLAMDIIAERDVHRKKGKLSIMLRSDNDREIPDVTKERTTKRYQSLVSYVEDTVYGISRAEDDPLNIDHKHVQLLMNATSLVMLGGNVLAGLANITLGKVLLLGEAVGGQYMDKETLMKAYADYNKDLFNGSILGDIGRHQHQSKTNQLGDVYDPKNDGKAEIFQTGRNKVYKRLATRSSLQFANSMGEHMLSNLSMYAVLHKLKVIGADGKYLKADGTSTENEKEAVSLADAYVPNSEGEYHLMKGASAIMMQGRKLSLEGPARARTLVRVRHVIQQTNEDLYGAYGENNRVMAQRYVAGQMALMFRKWMPAGFRRRYRGISKVWVNQVPAERWSQFYNDSHEGIYTTVVRFLWQAKREAQAAKAGELAMEQYGRYTTNLKRLWENRSEMESANIRRTATELAALAAAWVLAGALRDMAEDAPEDEEPYWYLGAFVARRLQSELFFYSNLSEFMNILRTPAASLSFTEEILQVIWQGFSPTEQYESGRRKGEYKIWKETTDILPLYKQFDSIFNAKERLAFYN